MTFGTDWGAGDARRHDWKSPLRDQARAVATRLRLNHHGIWAMEGSIEQVGVAVTELVGARSVKLSIDVTASRSYGPEGLTGVRGASWLSRLLRRLRRRGTVIGEGRAAFRLWAANRDAVEAWLTDSRCEAIEALGRIDGKLMLDRRGVRLVSDTIGTNATEVERSIQVMTTAVARFSS